MTKISAGSIVVGASALLLAMGVATAQVQLGPTPGGGTGNADMDHSRMGGSRCTQMVAVLGPSARSLQACEGVGRLTRID